MVPASTQPQSIILAYLVLHRAIPISIAKLKGLFGYSPASVQLESRDRILYDFHCTEVEVAA